MYSNLEYNYDENLVSSHNNYEFVYSGNTTIPFSP